MQAVKCQVCVHRRRKLSTTYLHGTQKGNDRTVGVHKIYDKAMKEQAHAIGMHKIDDREQKKEANTIGVYQICYGVQKEEAHTIG